MENWKELLTKAHAMKMKAELCRMSGQPERAAELEAEAERIYAADREALHRQAGLL